jgi:hypothetical protein
MVGTQHGLEEAHLQYLTQVALCLTVMQVSKPLPEPLDPEMVKASLPLPNKTSLNLMRGVTCQTLCHAGG